MAILEAKKAILEAKMARSYFSRGLLDENSGMRKAYSEARTERVQLEYGTISYAGHP